MPGVIVVDTASLIDLAKAGIGSGGNPTTYLDDLLSSGSTIVVNSVIYDEATRGTSPDALIIRNWLDQHRASGDIVFHDLGPELTNHYLSMPENGGEMSIVERTAVDPSIVGLGDDIRILTRDGNFLETEWWKNSPFNEIDNLVDPLDMYGERFVNNGLQADDWAQITVTVY